MDTACQTKHNSFSITSQAFGEHCGTRRPLAGRDVLPRPAHLMDASLSTSVHLSQFFRDKLQYLIKVRKSSILSLFTNCASKHPEVFKPDVISCWQNEVLKLMTGTTASQSGKGVCIDRSSKRLPPELNTGAAFGYDLQAGEVPLGLPLDTPQCGCLAALVAIIQATVLCIALMEHGYLFAR
eukprot:scaffold234757_cov44-Prasinocladus_malaysianus.AAC.4